MPQIKQRRISDVAFKIDRELNVIDANRSFLRLFDTVTSNINLKNYMNATDCENFMHFLQNFRADMENPYFIVEFHPRGYQLNCIVQVSKDGDIFSATLQELSYLLEMLDKTIFENRKYHKILGSFNSYFFTFDGSRFLMQNTKNLTDMFEGDTAAFKDYFVDFFQVDVSKPASAKQVSRLFDDMSRKAVDKRYRMLRLDGTQLNVRTREFSTRDRTEYIALVSTTGVIADETTFSEKYDGLTNVYNKATVTQMITNKINVSKQAGSLFIIDVDKFKECNDTFGHAFGDKVLVAVSKVIREAVQGVGFAGRIGGDEFICFTDKTDEYDVRNIARSIRLGIQWAIPAINPESVVTSSIGIVRVPENAATYEDAFKIADKCLYIAKSRGRNCYVIYRPELHDGIIMQNEDAAKHIQSGKTYAEHVDAEMQILSMLSARAPDMLATVSPLLLSYLEVHKMTVYRYDGSAYKLLHTSGKDDVTFRKDRLTDDYFTYFNGYDFFQSDNLLVFDTIDKEKLNLYKANNVASTLEVLCRDDAGNPLALVCYDVFKPARTFPRQKIVFGILAAKLLAKGL